MINANHFPPKTLTCPYCGQPATRISFTPDTGVARFTHRPIEEAESKGGATYRSLGTIHVFAAKWDGNKWRHTSKADLGSSLGAPEVVTIPTSIW
jgi:hypothetical protein